MSRAALRFGFVAVASIACGRIGYAPVRQSPRDASTTVDALAADALADSDVDEATPDVALEVLADASPDSAVAEAASIGDSLTPSDAGVPSSDVSDGSIATDGLDSGADADAGADPDAARDAASDADPDASTVTCPAAGTVEVVTLVQSTSADRGRSAVALPDGTAVFAGDVAPSVGGTTVMFPTGVLSVLPNMAGLFLFREAVWSDLDGAMPPSATAPEIFAAPSSVILLEPASSAPGPATIEVRDLALGTPALSATVPAVSGGWSSSPRGAYDATNDVVYVIGEVDAADFGGGVTITAAGTYDAVVAALSGPAPHRVAWVRQFGRPGATFASAQVAIALDDGVVVSLDLGGSSYAFDVGVRASPIGQYLVKLDRTGVVTWAISLSAPAARLASLGRNVYWNDGGVTDIRVHGVDETGAPIFDAAWPGAGNQVLQGAVARDGRLFFAGWSDTDPLALPNAGTIAAGSIFVLEVNPSTGRDEVVVTAGTYAVSVPATMQFAPFSVGPCWGVLAWINYPTNVTVNGVPYTRTGTTRFDAMLLRVFPGVR